MKNQIITLHIYRFDPARDQQPLLKDYTVPAYEGMSVMQALDYIYENTDPTLAYYDHAACAQGICGRCSVLIDGKISLMCQTCVQDGMTLQAPDRSRIIKDLVYDRGGK